MRSTAALSDDAAVTGRRRLLPVTRAAVLLDAIALGFLAAAIVAAFQREGFFSLLMWSCLLGLPTAGVAAVTSAIALVREADRRGVRRRVAMPVALVLALAAMPTGTAAVSAAWNATPNPADEALRPMVAAAQAAGAKRLCAEGDPGLGPDNGQPWRTVWLRMPADDAGLARVQRAAATHGYALQAHRPDRAVGEESVRGTRYLRSAAGASIGVLEMDVASRTIPLNCGGGDYGRPFRPAAGEVGVRLSMALPYRD